ncbi:hypothetical protein [Erwinia persicina]|uniref:hypothetical protein n=1 Tax=Erwinia persicina TaxID=55211 RepID=UPI001786A5DE|nr:hypothetical protein [Erwinia persicina]MBD8162483.1 hypothetical protein [Erwinia persicina]
MHKKKYAIAVSIIFGLLLMAWIVWKFIHQWYHKDFTCSASIFQHYNQERLDVSLSYVFRGDEGVVSMNGRSVQYPDKVFNREVSFRFNRRGDLYSLVSWENIKLPGDNVNDGELSRYEPDFFIYPNKKILMRIVRQPNGNYLFMINSIPAYICNDAFSVSGE